MNYEHAYNDLRQKIEDLVRPPGIFNAKPPQIEGIKDFYDLREKHVTQMIKELGDDPYKG